MFNLIAHVFGTQTETRIITNPYFHQFWKIQNQDELTKITILFLWVHPT